MVNIPNQKILTNHSASINPPEIVCEKTTGCANTRSIPRESPFHQQKCLTKAGCLRKAPQAQIPVSPTILNE